MTLLVNYDSDKPIYMQIFSQISSQILEGELKPGHQLPPIRSIANELIISVIPVKKAWEELDRKGYIKTITGKGTFVSDLSQIKICEMKNNKIDELCEEIIKIIKGSNLDFEEVFLALKEKLK